MKAAWKLPQVYGPSYIEVIKKFPEKYELRRGDIWSKNPWYKIAEYKFPGRPITKKSLEIEHDFKNPDKLSSSFELARLLNEHNCSDFTEIPSRQSLLEVVNIRFPKH
ncbi:MAG: hypothetical protein ABIA78_01370 [archaeon]